VQVLHNDFSKMFSIVLLWGKNTIQVWSNMMPCKEKKMQFLFLG